MPRYIYLHGFASSPSSRKARLFKDNFDALGIELRVPEMDEGDFEGLTVGRQLKVLEREADGAPDVVLIGSSLGGYVAALYAARHAEQVSKLVLLAPAFCFPKHWTDELGQDGIRAWRERGSMEIYHYGAKAQRRIGYQLIEESTAYEDYPEANQPALLLHGTADSIVPSGYSEEFAARHPKTSRVILLTSGHELTDVMDTLWNESAKFLDL